MEVTLCILLVPLSHSTRESKEAVTVFEPDKEQISQISFSE